jgi:dolichol-phosphate hexosyltransferase
MRGIVRIARSDACDLARQPCSGHRRRRPQREGSLRAQSDSAVNVPEPPTSAGRTQPGAHGDSYTNSHEYLASGRSPHRHRKVGLQRPLKLSIIMAAYNEEETIEHAVNEILDVDYPCDMEMLVIDDGSTDATPHLLANVDDPRVRIYRHAVNKGKGAALLTGCRMVTGTHMLPFDADLEYVAEDILKLLEPVLRGRCSVVYGVRLFGYNTVYRSYLYAVGNRTLTRLTNILFGACLSDLHTCLKLIPTTMLRSLRLTETGFGLDTEISASLLRHGVRPFEVPVSYFSRSHEEGKKITWRDALACLRILLRVRTQSRRKFEALSEKSTWVERNSVDSETSLLANKWEPPPALTGDNTSVRAVS